MFIAGPIVSLVAGGGVFWAATLGYLGIAVFVGAIAARYGFVEHRRHVLQLLMNTAIACLFSGFFYAVFLLMLLL
jgi:hypothetical protein